MDRIEQKGTITYITVNHILLFFFFRESHKNTYPISQSRLDGSNEQSFSNFIDKVNVLRLNAMWTQAGVVESLESQTRQLKNGTHTAYNKTGTYFQRFSCIKVSLHFASRSLLALLHAFTLLQSRGERCVHFAKDKVSLASSSKPNWLEKIEHYYRPTS